MKNGVCVGLICVATFAVAPASGAEYRIRYQGSPELAMESSGVMTASGVGGTNLSEGTAVAVPTRPGERIPNAGVPNQIVTFLHPYTNEAIRIPLTLPVGRPRVLIRRDRVIYDYGFFSQRVVVRFLPNGQAEVIYRT